MTPFARALALAAALAGLLVPAASATVFLNEIRIHDEEAVEFYNRALTPVDLSGWTITGEAGAFVVPAGTIIDGETYLTVSDLGGIFDDIGGETTVIDLESIPRDRVEYGLRGSAPLPPDTGQASLARAPDAATAVPPAPDATTDGFVWTIAFKQTLGFPNPAPVPVLGTGVRLNEASPVPSSGDDALELYVPSSIGGAVDVSDWLVVAGGAVVSIPPGTTIPAGSPLALPPLTGIELEATTLVYLFSADSTRVDQFGFDGAPPLPPDTCVARMPDGEGPANGWNFVTSELNAVACSIGEENCPMGDCATPVHEHSWGRIKATYGR